MPRKKTENNKEQQVRFDPDRPLAGRLPPLTMLRAFEASGRTGSMRKAARDIGVSHTVISRHIQNLEAWIGWKLLNAGPRGISMTAEGQTLFRIATDAFQSIATTAAQLRSKAGKDELHIWGVPGLTTRWLIPRLEEIRKVIGFGEVLVRAKDREPDFYQGEADLMIGFAETSSIPVSSEKLIEPRMFPVASPAWLETHGTPDSIDILVQSPLIHEESYAQWTSWFRLAGVDTGPVLKGPRLWDANLGFDAALAGQGVALTSNLMAAKEIRNGRLVELFETNIRVGGYYLVKSPAAAGDPRVKKFQSWLEITLAESEVRYAGV